MFKYLKHNDIDKNKWDNCIDNSINSLVYAKSFYLDVVSPNWEAVVYKDYDAVMPITYKSKFSIKYVMQPLFAQQLGIFFTGEISQKITDEFLKYVKYGFLYSAYNLNYLNKPSPFINSKERTNLILILNNDYDYLKNKFSDNTKRNINKAVKNNVVIESTLNIDLFLNFLEKYGFDDYTNNMALLKKLLHTLLKKNLLDVVCAKKDNQVVSMAVFVNYNSRIINLAPVSSEKGKESSAMFLLLAEQIKKYSASSTILDFEGSNVPGVKRFYKGFGAEEQNYFHIYKKIF